MSVTTIFANLTERQLLTTADTNTLRACQDRPIEFLTNVLTIFEQKAQKFHDTTHSTAKYILRQTVSEELLQSTATEKILLCAFSVFLEQDKIAFLPSVYSVLKRSSQELLVSCGLKSSTPHAPLTEIVKQLFFKYTARHRIFQLVDTTALVNLVQEVGRQNPSCFPLHLLNSFLIEKQVASELKAIQNPTTQIYAQRIAQKVASEPALFYEGLRGILYYLGTLIKNQNVSPELRGRHFQHLETDQAHLEFVDLVARGCIAEMSLERKQLELLVANATALQDPVSTKCMPALTLIEMQMTVDTTIFQQRVNQLQESIRRTQENGRLYEEQVTQAKTAANRQIDEWRSKVPDRQITYGVRIGFNL